MSEFLSLVTEPLATICLEWQVKSLNKMLRRHWAASKRHQEAAAWELLAQARHVPKAQGPRSVRITRLYAGRGKEMDMDNVIGGCKPLIDSMVKLRLLLGDTPELVQVSYRQMRATKAGTEVELWERP